MDETAMNIVIDYAMAHFDESYGNAIITAQILSKCKTGQILKYLISTSLPDCVYYEVTYDGKGEWKLNIYSIFDTVIPT